MRFRPAEALGPGGTLHAARSGALDLPLGSTQTPSMGHGSQWVAPAPWGDGAICTTRSGWHRFSSPMDSWKVWCAAPTPSAGTSLWWMDDAPHVDTSDVRPLETRSPVNRPWMVNAHNCQSGLPRNGQGWFLGGQCRDIPVPWCLWDPETENSSRVMVGGKVRVPA